MGVTATLAGAVLGAVTLFAAELESERRFFICYSYCNMTMNLILISILVALVLVTVYLLWKQKANSLSPDVALAQQRLELIIAELRSEIKNTQSERRSLDQRQSEQLTRLQTEMTSYREFTKELSASTTQLAATLSNNQTRGGWGERILEDLMRSNGLIEGVQYVRQKNIEGTTLRPDVLLVMPDKRVVAVDVKFPFSQIQKLSQTDNKSERELLLKTFASELRLKIDKVAEYILPASNTLDYAVLFVPNETVFSYINQHLPDVIDEAMTQRVLLVSPFSFLIVARTILESYRNFIVSDRLRGILNSLQLFSKEWEMYVAEFEKLGRSLQTTAHSYDTLAQTRFRQLSKRLEAVTSMEEHLTPALSDKSKLE